jgi:hypothetical protein
MSSDQGAQYSAFIEAQLSAEYDRRTALDTRGLSVVSTSGTLVGLVAAVAALTLGKDYKPTHVAAVALGLTLIAFITAAGLGIAANFLRKYKVADYPTYGAMLTTHWVDTEPAARNIAAHVNVQTLLSLREGSNAKAQQVTWALIMLLLGIASLAFAVVWEFVSHKY